MPGNAKIDQDRVLPMRISKDDVVGFEVPVVKRELVSNA